MRPDGDFWQTIIQTIFKLFKWDDQKPKKHAWCYMPWRPINQVLPIWARPGGGVVGGDGGDWSHWQRPLGGGHGEGAHHGGRTRTPPFVRRRLTQHRKRKTGTQEFSAFLFSFKVLGVKKPRSSHFLTLFIGCRKKWMDCCICHAQQSLPGTAEKNVFNSSSWRGIGRAIWRMPAI